MKTFDSDWIILKAAGNELQDYLFSAEIYWPIAAAGSIGKITLTPGALLLSLKRLNALDLRGARREEFSLLASQILAIRKRWRANWLKKTQREYPLRVQMWKNYVHELVSDRKEHSPFYPQQVRIRTILHLLLSDSGEDKTDEILGGLDGGLRQVSRSGNFVWEPEIENGFSREEHWFLFRTFDEG